MSRRTVLVPLLTALLTAPIAATLPGALAGPPPDGRACEKTGPGSPPPGCPTPPPPPPAEAAEGSGTCLDIVSGLEKYKGAAGAGGVFGLVLEVGAGGPVVCTDAVYTLHLSDPTGAAAATSQSAPVGALRVAFAVPLPGYGKCVAARVTVEKDGVLQDAAPSTGTFEICDDPGAPAQNWR